MRQVREVVHVLTDDIDDLNRAALKKMRGLVATYLGGDQDKLDEYSDAVKRLRKRIFSRGLSPDQLMDEYLAAAPELKPLHMAMWLEALEPVILGSAGIGH